MPQKVGIFAGASVGLLVGDPVGFLSGENVDKDIGGFVGIKVGDPLEQFQLQLHKLQQYKLTQSARMNICFVVYMTLVLYNNPT